jgi:hypothetical protein
MKKTALILLSALLFFRVNAQSGFIKNVFRLLPADKVYGLTIATRDSMLQGKTYYPADNDSLQIEAYNYGESDYVKDYLYVSMSFETGQRASTMIEIRSFKRLNGDSLILVSAAGGVWQAAYSQHDVSAFIYGKDKKLIPYKKKILPEADESLFIKPAAPDSIRKSILNNSNMAFDLSNEKVMLSLNSNYISNNKLLRKWLKGDVIYFDWIKDQFIVSKIEFQFSD